MSRKISRSFINGRTGAGTAGQGIKVEWDSTNDGELHWMDVDESSLEAGPTWYGGRGVFGGGHTGSAKVNTIDYITISTTGNATDFGDMLATGYEGSGCSDGTRGIFTGYIDGGDNRIDEISYITVGTPSNATDFGNQSQIVSSPGCCSDGTTGLLWVAELQVYSEIT